MHCDTLKQDNDSTVRGDGEVGSARYEPALLPPCPRHGGMWGSTFVTKATAAQAWSFCENELIHDFINGNCKLRPSTGVGVRMDKINISLCMHCVV